MTSSGWRNVRSFEPASTEGEVVFGRLDRQLQEDGIMAQRWADDSGARAIVVSLRALLEAARRPASAWSSGLAPEGVEPAAQILFVSPAAGDAALFGLMTTLAEGGPDVHWPAWMGLPTGIESLEGFREMLRRIGVELPPAAGMIRYEPLTGPALLFHLHRLPPPAADRPPFRPVDQKIAEGPDNLRGREEWFQRRTGKR